MKTAKENNQELKKSTIQKVQKVQKIQKVQSIGGEATIKDNRQSTLVQRKLQVGMHNAANKPILQCKTNNTGLPDNLKSGIENLSGFSMDDVKVHYNSSKPAQLQAHAYAQGTDIHLAPNQEKHLPHEAWHVVQQKQGRVKPTRQLKSKVSINDDAGLEKEADVMGAKAEKNIFPTSSYNEEVKSKNILNNVVQREEAKIVDDKLNVIGETHYETFMTPTEAEQQRKNEALLAIREARGSYWRESKFEYDNVKVDSHYYRFWFRFTYFFDFFRKFTMLPINQLILNQQLSVFKKEKACLYEAQEEYKQIDDNENTIYQKLVPNDLTDSTLQDRRELTESAIKLVLSMIDLLENGKDGFEPSLKEYMRIRNEYFELKEEKKGKYYGVELEPSDTISFLRSEYMHNGANINDKAKGIWKIGNKHAKHIEAKTGKHDRDYNLITKEQFEPIYEKFERILKAEQEGFYVKPPERKVDTKTSNNSESDLDI